MDQRCLFPNLIPPYQHHSVTSAAAAEAIEPRALSLRGLVLLAIRKSGRHGLTDEEGILLTDLSPSTYRPRRVELCRMALVVDSKRHRQTKAGRKAVVWICPEYNQANQDLS